jgi:hypothetical protein
LAIESHLDKVGIACVIYITSMLFAEHALLYSLRRYRERERERGKKEKEKEKEKEKRDSEESDRGRETEKEGENR